MKLLLAVAWALVYMLSCAVLYLGYAGGLASDWLAEGLQ